MVFIRLFFHLLQNWNDHVKCGSFARVFVHTDLYELCHMGGNSRGDCQSETLRGYLKVYHKIKIRENCLNASAPTLMPASMGERSPKGSSLVASSQSKTAQLHISAARILISAGFLDIACKYTHTWGDSLVINKHYLWSNPCWVIHLTLLLKTELGIRHVDTGNQLVIGHAVNLEIEESK